MLFSEQPSKKYRHICLISPVTFEPLGLQRTTIAQNYQNWLRISNLWLILIIICHKIGQVVRKITLSYIRASQCETILNHNREFVQEIQITMIKKIKTMKINHDYFILLDELLDSWKIITKPTKPKEINFRFLCLSQFLKEIFCPQKSIIYCWNWSNLVFLLSLKHYTT